MYGAIHLPDFFLQALLRSRPELIARPVALLQEPGDTSALKDRGKATILQATEAALAHGVEIGMTATQGQARHDRLLLLYRSQAEEDATRDILLNTAECWTPDFEDTAPGVCTLDLFGNPEASAQPERLGLKIARMLSRHGLRPGIGFAPHPDLALLAAKQAAPVLVVDHQNGNAERFLSGLPVRELALPADILEVLHLWGIRTFGELSSLPAQEVGERLGPEAVHLLERAHGKNRRLLKLVRPPAIFLREMEFEHAIETLDPLLFVIRRQLETLSARLEAVHLMAQEIILALRFADESTHRRTFRVPDPCRDVNLLLRILHTHLDSFTAETPIVALALEIKPSGAHPHQFDLFKSSLRDPNTFSETLARLEALLGADRVGTPNPHPVHRPDAFAMRPFQEVPTTTEAGRTRARKPTPLEKALREKTTGIRLGLPLRRFRPPHPLTVLTEHNRPIAILSGPPGLGETTTGTIQGVLTDQRGPWLLSGDWWREERWSAREWDVQLEHQGLYRIAEINKDQWVLAGVYG